ncbi:MAG: tetratricopeptide repeat protein [Proteobacteria bacterium]|nr:tetratricopeptide repeat protein [Pseudomonadota bacterium]
MSGTRSVALLIALLGLPGCFLTRNQGASAEYSRQVMVASSRVAILEAQLGESQERIDTLEESLRAQGATEVTRLENIEQVNAEVGRLRGEIEVLQFELTQIKEMLEGSAMDGERRMLHAESRMEQVESFLGIEAPPPPTDAELGYETDGDTGDTGDGTVEGEPPDTVDVAEPEATPEDAQGKLDLAIEHMRDGRHGVARVLLEKALDAHPKDPLLPELRYRVAETWFNQGSWDRALTHFQTVVDSYADTEWAALAMLRQGESFAKKNQAANAELFYEEVIRIYPKSKAAREAKELLAQ